MRYKGTKKVGIRLSGKATTTAEVVVPARMHSELREVRIPKLPAITRSSIPKTFQIARTACRARAFKVVSLGELSDDLVDFVADLFITLERNHISKTATLGDFDKRVGLTGILSETYLTKRRTMLGSVVRNIGLWLPLKNLRISTSY